MKKAVRIISLVLALVMLSSINVFGSTPYANIISPASNSVLSGDSFLVSIKVTGRKTAKITVFEVMNFIDLKTNEETGAEEMFLSAVSVGEISENDLKIFSSDFEALKADDTDEKGVYKLPEKENSKETKSYKDIVVSDEVTFAPVADIGYYTKKVANLTPGLYRVYVEITETVNEKETVISTSNSFVALKEKTDTPAPETETESAGVITIITSFIKSIFK